MKNNNYQQTMKMEFPCIETNNELIHSAAAIFVNRMDFSKSEIECIQEALRETLSNCLACKDECAKGTITILLGIVDLKTIEVVVEAKGYITMKSSEETLISLTHLNNPMTSVKVEVDLDETITVYMQKVIGK